MKKTIVSILTIAALHQVSFSQNLPVVEKAAPKSNATLPSNGALGSNSGVNPAGNPGTIISYSGNSNSANTKLAPNPNVEKGTYLTSSPEGTVMSIPGVNDPNVQKTTVPVAARVQQETAPVSTSTVVTTEPRRVQPVTVMTAPPADVDGTKPTTAIIVPSRGKEIPSYSPVLGNYVPEEVVNRIKSKYTSVYDIKAIRIVSTNKIAYVVRLVENGQFRNEVYYDTQ